MMSADTFAVAGPNTEPQADLPPVLYGLRVASEIDLPLTRARGPVDVTISLASVVPAGTMLWQTEHPFPIRCRRQSPWTFFEWPRIRFAVSARRVIVDTEDLELAAHLLLHVIWSIVLDERGHASLHGSAVERNGSGVAILGRSGSGKSTAILKLLDSGWRLVSDDLLTFDDERRAIPGPPFVRLTEDRADGRAGEVDPGGKLRYYPGVCSSPVPLAAAIVHDAGYAEPTRLLGTRALDALLRQVYIPLPPQPGQASRRYALALSLIQQVPIYGVPPRSLSTATVMQLIEEARSYELSRAGSH